MYTEYFGLSEKPFSITPDPRYLYLSGRHAEALAHLLYGVTESGGFIQLTGEVGTGKTTLVRSLLEQLPEQAQIALVLNPRLSPMEFLQVICDELGVEVPAGDRHSSKALVDGLNRHLLTAHAAGRRVILIVDEAQNLSAEVLEQVRLLTNLETSTPEAPADHSDRAARSCASYWHAMIFDSSHRELRGATTSSPCQREETAASTFEHRLARSPVRSGRGIFDAVVLSMREVFRLSQGGMPRLINVICDRALLGAWSAESRQVSGALARAAAREVRGTGSPPRRWPWLILGSLGVASVAVAISMAFQPAARPPEAVAARPEASTSPPAETVARAPAASPPVPASASLTDPGPGPGIAAGPSGTAPAPADPAPRQESQPGGSAPGIEAGPATVATVATGAASVPETRPGPPPTLRELLMNRPSETTTSAALVELVNLWGVSAPGDINTCDRLRPDGLRCHFHRGSWSALVRLNRPAILALAGDGDARYQVVLVSASDGEEPVLKLGRERYSVPLADLMDLWTGDALIVWRPEAGDGRTLSLNAVGDDVLWLRESLSRVSGTAVQPLRSDLYDEPLAASVRSFQRRQQLDDDGIAGALTLIALNDALGLNGRPQLRPES